VGDNRGKSQSGAVNIGFSWIVESPKLCFLSVRKTEVGQFDGTLTIESNSATPVVTIPMNGVGE
jgi:hypothetical protein